VGCFDVGGGARLARPPPIGGGILVPPRPPPPRHAPVCRPARRVGRRPRVLEVGRVATGCPAHRGGTAPPPAHVGTGRQPMGRGGLQCPVVHIDGDGRGLCGVPLGIPGRTGVFPWMRARRRRLGGRGRIGWRAGGWAPGGVTPRPRDGVCVSARRSRRRGRVAAGRPAQSALRSSRSSPVRWTRGSCRGRVGRPPRVRLGHDTPPEGGPHIGPTHLGHASVTTHPAHNTPPEGGYASGHTSATHRSDPPRPCIGHDTSRTRYTSATPRTRHTSDTSDAAQPRRGTPRTPRAWHTSATRHISGSPRSRHASATRHTLAVHRSLHTS